MALSLLTTSQQLLALGLDPQILNVAPNQTVQGVISLKEPSRIAIDGGRVRAYDHRDGAVEVKRDAANGELRVIPPENVNAPINLFVTNEKGQTYTLFLTVSDVPSQTVILRDTTPTSKKDAISVVRSSEYEKNIKSVMVAMARNQEASDLDVLDHSIEFKLWQESRFILNRSWLGKAVVGDRFLLTNISNQVMRLAEPEFFRAGVLAVAIDDQELNPGSSTNVYILRQRSDNE